MRAGVTTSGIPNNINILRSMKQATGRRVALAAPYKKQLREAEEKLAQLLESTAPDQALLDELNKEIEHLRRRIDIVPFIDTIDLRYKP